MRLLQVSTADVLGGAERVALNLHHGFRAAGHEAWLAVGERRTSEPGVALLDHDPRRGPWARGCLALGRAARRTLDSPRGAYLATLASTALSDPRRAGTILRGHEDFDFPATAHLLELPPAPPDVVILHNLHGGYFDLRALPALAAQRPVILALHDAWLLAGHCVHSLGCERWRTGCGDCPDLSIPPRLLRDGSAENHRRKRAVFARARVHVVTPCEWLLRQVEQSLLAPALVGATVIPYGVDLTVFRPGSREEARAAFGLAPDDHVVICAANGLRHNRWKDFPTLARAVERVAVTLGDRPLTLLAAGEAGETTRLGRATVRWLPYAAAPEIMARRYHAADVMVHAARADTFPNVVLEALACGVPVVATRVGGIPEQIDDGRTGFLTSPGDAADLAARLTQLLTAPALRATMSDRATATAAARFGLPRQVDAYLSLATRLGAAPQPRDGQASGERSRR